MKPSIRNVLLHLIEGEIADVTPQLKEALSKIPQPQIIAVGERGAGNANTLYKILDPNGNNICSIGFQPAPVPEVGVVGATNETLLAIVADRLEGFQQDKFPCMENAAALDLVKNALAVLHARTMRRIAQQTEGQHIEHSPDRPVDPVVDTSKTESQQDPVNGTDRPNQTITIPPTEPQES